MKNISLNTPILLGCLLLGTNGCNDKPESRFDSPIEPGTRNPAYIIVTKNNQKIIQLMGGNQIPSGNCYSSGFFLNRAQRIVEGSDFDFPEAKEICIASTNNNVGKITLIEGSDTDKYFSIFKGIAGTSDGVYILNSYHQ